MTASDIVEGGTYCGGKLGRMRVVELITNDAYGLWVRYHWNGHEMSLHYVPMATFLKWAKERV